MLFALLCTDKPDNIALRLKLRPEHVIFLEGLGKTLKFAGPFLDDAGNPTGSLVVIEAGTRDEALAMAARDPFAIGGLFAATEVKAWRWAFHNPETT
jgi:uncharacterized protein